MDSRTRGRNRTAAAPPHDALHAVEVMGLEGLVEVDPAGLPGDIAAPLVGVAHHRAAAELVEAGDAPMRSISNFAVLVLPSCFSASSWAGPCEVQPNRRSILRPPHGLVTRHHILGVPGQQISVVRRAIGERRSIAEHEVFLGIPRCHRLVEDAVTVPAIQNIEFDVRKVWSRGTLSDPAFGADAHGTGHRANAVGAHRRPLPSPDQPGEQRSRPTRLARTGRDLPVPGLLRNPPETDPDTPGRFPAIGRRNCPEWSWIR